MSSTMVSMIAALRDRSDGNGIHFGTPSGKEHFVDYPGFYRKIVALAQGFREQGIGPASRILVPLATTADALGGMLALIWMGALPFSIKTPSAGSDRNEYQEFVKVLAERYGACAILDTGGLDRLTLAVPTLSLQEIQGTQEDCPPVHPAPDAIAFVQFSSGTTGVPKGIPIRHGQLMRQLEIISGHDGRTPQDVGASWLPLYHDMGLVGLLSSVHVGQDLYWDTPSDFLMRPLEWLASLAERRIFVTALPNFGLNYLLRHLRNADEEVLQGHSFERLKHIYVGSDSIDPRTLSEFAQTLAPYGFSADALTPCYGMAEAVLMVTCKPRGESPGVSTRPNGQAFVSVGVPKLGFEIRVLDEEGTSCAEGDIGRVMIRGGTLASSYFEHEIPLCNEEGFYDSGDIGYFADGRLHITGRAGERVKINGQSFFLPQFEHVVQTHADVRPGGVAALQADGKLVILVEPRRAGSSDQLHALKREMVDLILAKCGIKIATDDVLLVARGQLKRTSSGKLQRGRMTRAYLDGTLSLLGENVAPR